MAHILAHPGGVTLTLPDGVAAVSSPDASARRGRSARGSRYAPQPLEPAGSDAGGSPEGDLLAEAFAGQEFDVVALPALTVTPSPTRRRGATPEPVALDVPLADDEAAVVLVEQDGVFTWQLPEAEREAAPAERTTRRGGEAQRVARFTLPVDAADPDALPAGRTTRGPIKDWLVGQALDRVKLYVMRFVARKATGAITDRLEAHVRPGFVVMHGLEPDRWPRVDSLADLDVPRDRPARILLFVHGTFSSTVGGYGALAAYPWGQALLDEAAQQYDAVLGFDHPTLSVDPEANARDLLERLRRGGEAQGVHLDVVTHSRGGLVFRSLAELVLPGAAWKPTVGQVVFTGTPNGGTHLAHPENWGTLADLYTNIAVGVFRALQLVPGVGFVPAVLKELVQGLGALVKVLAAEVVDGGAIPGLAAMQPGGAFVTRLNAEQPGQPGIDTTRYCAITSTFRAQLTGEHEPRELPRRLLMALGDRFTDRLFGQANDLVVDTDSMKAVDRDLGVFVRDALDFGENPVVYHTNYFTRPEVTAALSRWLGLPAYEAPAAGPPRRRRSAPSLPVQVSDRIVTTTADATAGELLDDLQGEEAEYVVVRRWHEGQTLNYAYARAEVEQMLRGAVPGEDTPLLDALGMHEYQASQEERVEGGGRSAGGGYGPTAQRTVVLDAGRPVGVVRDPAALPTAAELAHRAAPPRQQQRQPSPASGRRPRGGTPASGAPPLPAAPAPSRGLPDAAGADPEEAAPEEAAATGTCHFYAEMDGTLRTGETVSLIVAVSREAMRVAAGQATATGQSDAVDLDRQLILDVRARRNLEVVGEARATLDPPAPGAPEERYFDVRATHPGEGEVHVTARQGQQPLVTLKLVVAISDALPDARPRARAEGEALPPAPQARPLAQLRIFERDNGDEIAYEYDLDLPGVVFDRYASPAFKADRQAYVDGLYQEIEQRWLSVDDDLEDFDDELKALGARLFDELFPLDLQQVLWQHRDALDRIQVVSTEPFIPWELVFLKAPGQPGLPDDGAFLAEKGLVRWLHGSWFPDAIKVREGRVRYVIPDYPVASQKLPEAQQEKAFLEARFGATPVEPQPRAVRTLLKEPGAFDLLHFACHGEAEMDHIPFASLLMEGRVENGQAIPAYVSATTVGEHSRLAAPDGNRPMVVLNACQAGRLGFHLTRIGGFAEAFLRGGAGAFVGTLWSVADAPARFFTEALYEALEAGDALAEATRKARQAARFEDASWLAYAVYGHPHARWVRT